jgi:hypothetical protein
VIALNKKNKRGNKMSQCASCGYVVVFAGLIDGLCPGCAEKKEKRLWGRDNAPPEVFIPPNDEDTPI